MTVTTDRHRHHKCHSFASHASPPPLGGDVVTVTETETVRSGRCDLAHRVRRLAPLTGTPRPITSRSRRSSAGYWRLSRTMRPGQPEDHGRGAPRCPQIMQSPSSPDLSRKHRSVNHITEAEQELQQ